MADTSRASPPRYRLVLASFTSPVPSVPVQSRSRAVTSLPFTRRAQARVENGPNRQPPAGRLGLSHSGVHRGDAMDDTSGLSPNNLLLFRQATKAPLPVPIEPFPSVPPFRPFLSKTLCGTDGRGLNSRPAVRSEESRTDRERTGTNGNGRTGQPARWCCGRRPWPICQPPPGGSDSLGCC